MVARGGVGNPFLITQMDAWFRYGRRLPNPTIAQQIDWCMQLSDAVIKENGEEVGVRKLRSIAPKFVAGCTRCKGNRRMLATVPTTRKELFDMLLEIKERAGNETARSLGVGDAACVHEED
ncbi:MAG: tRNA-dihydrouridine synthase [Candidatus Methanomethylophilaceae archaeon]|nr:tRNA-dihydrouridine synthase [Candidatus Methanomethylophilaceae archaeon]